MGELYSRICESAVDRLHPSAEDCPRLLVVLNLSHRPCRYNPDPPFRGTIIASTWPDAEGQRLEAEICLYGDEGIVVRLD